MADRPMSIPALTVLRVERGARHLHTLGPRAIAEFLLAVAGKIGGTPAILGMLAEYERRLTPAMLRATGGDRFVFRDPLAVPAPIIHRSQASPL